MQPTHPRPQLSPRPQGVALGWRWALPFLGLLISAPVWLHWYEPQWFLAINHAAQVLPAVVWTGLSLLGNGWAVLAVTSPLLLCAPRLLWAWLCAAPFVTLMARGGKAYFDSPRPAAVLDVAQFRIVGEALEKVSMPSGHTLTAFGVASAIYFALPAARRWRFGWLWLLAAGAGLSRIAVGAHWPGDVAVGACLGVLAGLLAQHLLLRVPQTWMQPTHWALRAVALLMALTLYHLVTDELDFAENRPLQWALAVVVAGVLLVFVWRWVRGLKRGG